MSATATDVPQRQLRNETAKLLRRVEAGERLRVTVHGHPVAELGPPRAATAFLSRDRLVDELGGLLDGDDRLDEELRGLDTPAIDPYA